MNRLVLRVLEAPSDFFGEGKRNLVVELDLLANGVIFYSPDATGWTRTGWNLAAALHGSLRIGFRRRDSQRR